MKNLLIIGVLISSTAAFGTESLLTVTNLASKESLTRKIDYAEISSFNKGDDSTYEPALMIHAVEPSLGWCIIYQSVAEKNGIKLDTLEKLINEEKVKVTCALTSANSNAKETIFSVEFLK